MLLQVQGIVSEYERAKIMERSRRGKRHTAHRGSLNVMSSAPFGYRYITIHDGDGEARSEIISEQAGVVRDIFKWVGKERCTLGEVCRRLQSSGKTTATGKHVWSRQTVWHILQNPVYQGTAAYGKTRMMPRTKKSRPRPSKGRPAEPSKRNTPVAIDQKEWVFMPAPAIVDKSLFNAAQDQLHENRTRARLGPRRPGYLLQGLTCCALCGYSFYGKTVRQRGRGRILTDFSYYRCSGTDGYRFGGERICSNKQIRASTVESDVWENVCKILKNPTSLEQEDHGSSSQRSRVQENIDTLTAQRQKLQHGMDRLIDSLAEGVIEKDQFPARITRTKARIADIDVRIAQVSDEDRDKNLRSVKNRLAELWSHLQNQIANADWTTKREIIRAVVQRIEIGPKTVAVVLRLPTETRTHALDPIMLTLSRA